MVMTTSKPISPRLADMNREDAEEVTRLIKENFDSLGDMLLQARDRKAYKALGYRSFESYCQSEFGKSISSAYQLIEDAKVLSQLEARISEEYGEDVTLKFPSSHLKPLKAIDNIDDKIKAIEYAQKLAAAENRKATKKDLEIAVFQVSGKRSEDFREAIQSLGFQRGVQVEVSKSLNKDRGFVTKVDKGGQIYVELHYGGVVPIPYDAADLRILTKAEQPANPASDNTLNKGDKVKIFAKGLEGKTGEVYIWKPGKLVSVVVEDTTLPVDIAYAELEAIPTNRKDSSWESEMVWDAGKNTYYYFPKEDKIYSNQWPTGLTLEPYTHSGNPAQFMEHWEANFAGKVLGALANPARTKTLALAQAIELPESEAKEFASDLIASLRQLFWDEIPGSPSALLEENQRLHEQLAEAETAIQAMIAAASTAPYDTVTPSDFLLENNLETSSPGESAPGNDFSLENNPETSSPRESAPGNDFSLENNPKTSSPGESAPGNDFSLENNPETSSPRESAPGNDFLLENDPETSSPGEAAPGNDFLLENNPETSSPGEAAPGNDFLLENDPKTSNLWGVAEHANLVKRIDYWKQLLETKHFVPIPYRLDGFFKGSWRGWKLFFHPRNSGLTTIDLANDKKEMFTRCVEGDEDETIQWVKALIDKIEDFSPGQLSLDLQLVKNITSSVEIAAELPPNISSQIPSIRNKLFSLIEKYEQSKRFASKRKEIENLDENIKSVQERLKELEKFEYMRIGHTICHQRQPMILGKIIGFDFSQGEMPIVWVKYFKDGELEKTPTSELVSMIFIVEI